MKTGISLCTFPKRENPVFITWEPCNENRFFPGGKVHREIPVLALYGIAVCVFESLETCFDHISASVLWQCSDGGGGRLRRTARLLWGTGEHANYLRL